MGRWRPSLQRRHLDFQHEQNRSGFHSHRQATPIYKGMGEVFPWLPLQQLFAHPDMCLPPSVHKPRIPAGHVTPSAPPATTPYLGNTKLSSSHGLKLQPHPCPRTLGSWPPLLFTLLKTWSPQGSKGQCFYWLFPEGIGIQSHQIFRHFREGLNSRFFFM